MGVPAGAGGPHQMSGIGGQGQRARRALHSRALGLGRQRRRQRGAEILLVEKTTGQCLEGQGEMLGMGKAAGGTGERLGCWFAPQVEVTCTHGWHLLLREMKAPATSSSPSVALFSAAKRPGPSPRTPSHPPPAPQHLWVMKKLPQPPSGGALCD